MAKLKVHKADWSADPVHLCGETHNWQEDTSCCHEQWKHVNCKRCLALRPPTRNPKRGVKR